MDISNMTKEQKELLLEIATETIRDFNNEMIDHWDKENYRIAENCREKLDELVAEYTSKFGELPSWPYINDVVSAKETLERNLSD
jgi:hypothetical protein